MVGLYRDPEGDKITFVSSVVVHTNGNSTEVRELRRRVSELENSLIKQHVSISDLHIPNTSSLIHV